MPCVFSQNSLGQILFWGRFLHLPSSSKAQRLQNLHIINQGHSTLILTQPSKRGDMTTKSLNEAKENRGLWQGSAMTVTTGFVLEFREGLSESLYQK